MPSETGFDRKGEPGILLLARLFASRLVEVEKLGSSLAGKVKGHRNGEVATLLEHQLRYPSVSPLHQLWYLPARCNKSRRIRADGSCPVTKFDVTGAWLPLSF